MKTIKSNNYIKIAETTNKYSGRAFIGDCVTGLEYPYFQSRIANDATQLAQIVENGVEISEQQFFNMTSLHNETVQKLASNPENYKYYYNKDADVVWFYDESKDTEYFYV